MKIREFISFITIQAIMVCLLTFNPIVSHYGVAEAATPVYSAGASAGLERMYDLQGALKGYGAQDSFKSLGPRVAEEGQKFIASLKGKDRDILTTPKGARFLKEHSRLSRVHALKTKLAKCGQNLKSSRQLDKQVISTIENSEYNGGCDFRLYNSRRGMITNATLDDYLNDLDRVQKVMNNGSEVGVRLFQDELHKQAVKNSLASYLSHRYKYEPGFINPKTGKISSSHKNASINAMCKNEDNKYTCDSRMKKEYGDFIEKKAMEIAATQKKSTYQGALNNLRKGFKKLNRKLDKITIGVSDGWIDSADVENPKTKAAWQDYHQTYIQELQGQDGLLIMTERMKDEAGGLRTMDNGVENKGSWINERYQMKRHDPYGFTVNDLKTAKSEIQSKVISQAKQLNQMASEKKNQHKKWRENNYKNSGWGWDRKEIYSERIDDIAKLVKTNPAAVGQVLLDNPQYASMVCDAFKRIDEQDESDKKWDSVMMIGGLIVAGAMIIGGGACVVLSFGLCTPLAGASIAGGITIGSAVTATVLVAGGIEAAYWSKRTYDHHKEYQELEQAVFSNNMEEKFGAKAVEDAYSAFKEARFNALMALPAVILPGVGKLASFSKGSKFASALKGMSAAGKVKFMDNMSAFYKFLSKSPKLQKVVDALITSGKLPASKIHDFFSMIAQGKKGLNAKFLGYLSKKLDKIDDAKGLSAFQKKFQSLVEEGLEAAQRACKI